MRAALQKIQYVIRRVHIHRKCVANVRIEIRQPRAVQDHINILRETIAHFRRESEVRLAHVTIDDFDALTQELTKSVAMLLRERIKNRRFFNRPLKPLQGSVGTVVADQQIHAANFRQVPQQICEPHFADETRAADQQNLFSAQRVAHR